MTSSDLDPELPGDQPIDVRRQVAQAIGERDRAGEQQPHKCAPCRLLGLGDLGEAT